jgi:hypothetical protein
MLGTRMAVVLTAAGITAVVVVGCHSPIPEVSPTAPGMSLPAQPAAGPGLAPQPGGVNHQPDNGLPPNQEPIPGVEPIPGLQPVPDGPTAPGSGDDSAGPIPGVPPAPPNANAKSGEPIPGVRPEPIPGVRPEPMPPELLPPEDLTVPKDLTGPTVSSP